MKPGSLFTLRLAFLALAGSFAAAGHAQWSSDAADNLVVGDAARLQERRGLQGVHRCGDELRWMLLPAERAWTRLRSCELTTSSGMALSGGGRVDQSRDTETGVTSRSSMRYG